MLSSCPFYTGASPSAVDEKTRIRWTDWAIVLVCEVVRLGLRCFRDQNPTFRTATELEAFTTANHVIGDRSLIPGVNRKNNLKVSGGDKPLCRRPRRSDNWLTTSLMLSNSIRTAQVIVPRHQSPGE